MSIDVQATRDLLACKDAQLAEVAARHNVTSAVAQVVRTHYTRRITDRCVQCGRLLKKGKCSLCKTAAAPAFELLQELQPKVVLIRTKCATCDRVMSFRAGHILKVTQQYGFFRPPKECPKCKAKKERMLKKEAEKQNSKSKKPTTSQTSPKKKSPKMKKMQILEKKVPKHSDGLFHRPFMVLEGLKIEK